MAAERGGQSGRIGLHVEHGFQNMPHMSQARPAEIMADMRDPAPFRDGGIGGIIALQTPDNQVRHGSSHPDGDSGEFRNRAEIVAAQLHESGSVLIIHGVKRLERRQNDRAVHCPDNRTESRACRISDHVHEQQIKIGSLQFGQDFIGFSGVVDHAEIEYGHAVPLQFLHENGSFPIHFLQQPGKLLPVGIKSDGDHSDIRIQFPASFNFHFSSPCKKKISAYVFEYGTGSPGSLLPLGFHEAVREQIPDKFI